jgi:hypothetical protein
MPSFKTRVLSGYCEWILVPLPLLGRCHPVESPIGRRSRVLPRALGDNIDNPGVRPGSASKTDESPGIAKGGSTYSQCIESQPSRMRGLAREKSADTMGRYHRNSQKPTLWYRLSIGRAGKFDTSRICTRSSPASLPGQSAISN